MRHFASLVLLCSYFMLTVCLGLYTAHVTYPLMYPPPGQVQVIEPIVADPQDVSSTFWLFVYVIIVTAVMLALMRLGLGGIIQAAMYMSFFAGSFITFSAFLGEPAALTLSLASLAALLMRRGDLILANTAMVFTISGVGAILGLSLGIWPVFAFIVLLSAYDYVAVFVTKHMVTLAKGSKGRFGLMFLVPVGDRMMGLGAGDVAIPTTFVVSVYVAHGIGYAVPTAYGGLIGVVSLFYYLMDREGATLPALPPITAGLLIGYGLCLLILR
ncbi:MAG: presenilin family intramembrane aspartyl protease [Candidatus Altiarchaeota archaeon]